jgi:hypothetical protein
MTAEIINLGEKAKLNAVSDKLKQLRETRPAKDEKPSEAKLAPLKESMHADDPLTLKEPEEDFAEMVMRKARERIELKKAGIIDFEYERGKKLYNPSQEGYVLQNSDDWHRFAVREGIISESKPPKFAEEEARELDELHDAICNLSYDELRAWGKKKGYE